MTAEEELVRQRLNLLQLAEALGNVSEACRRRGISRTQFYEYRRRFQAHGLEGPKDLPPIHKSHPLTTRPEVEERAIALSCQHPSWGCTRLSNWLKDTGTSISSPTVQRILIKHGLGTRYHRWLKLRERQATEGTELTEEQAAFMERQNRASKSVTPKPRSRLSSAQMHSSSSLRSTRMPGDGSGRLERRLMGRGGIAPSPCASGKPPQLTPPEAVSVC